MQSSKPTQIRNSKEKFSELEVQDLLRKYPEWAVENGMLVRFWTFNDFVQAIAFVNRVAQLAEQAGHHPDIDIRYNKVRLGLVTHDAGGITQNDIDLAQDIDKRFEKNPHKH